MPTSSTHTIPSPTILKNRGSASGGSGPRSTSNGNPNPPSSNASPTKYAQRTKSSVRVGPDAPYASVGGGAAMRTPNVHTPETTCPSDDSACQRTVYAPRASDLAGTTIRRGAVASCVVPDSTSPVALSRTIEFGNAFTPWSKRIHTDWGARSSRCLYEGQVAKTLACAKAFPGTTSAHN